MSENIYYAKTVYGKKEIDAVIKCLQESTQMGNYSRKFETKLQNYLKKKRLCILILDLPHYM